VMEILMAAYKSSEIGKEVRFPDPQLVEYRPKAYREAEKLVKER